MDSRKFLERWHRVVVAARAQVAAGAWPRWAPGTALAALLLVVFGAGYLLVVAGDWERLASARHQEVELRREYQDRMAVLANLSAYRIQRESVRTAFASLVKRLPRNTEVADLVENIARAAAGNDLTVRSIAPQSERGGEFHVELPVDISVQGGFHQIGAFVSRVAALPRIVTLHDFTLEAEGMGEVLSMDILAKTYRTPHGPEAVH